MDLLFFWKWINKWDLILFGFNCLEEDELDILNHGVKNIVVGLFWCASQRNGIGVIERHGTEVDLSVGFLHDEVLGIINLVMLIYRIIIMDKKQRLVLMCLFDLLV